ncbi:hypothetical protein GXW77_13725 [Roseomonas alkaliterrae]|uniref:hypothetical protein n=1 Tax=Neoroseomonas alkaliterrae TaxID=1452450 RepID=UPI001BA9344D|nr:hypothetical protein [Neoroseomonas alkaliterrae]MBR0677236.1 hypothetical protein [Neoroseomonas alkaliterrae]
MSGDVLGGLTEGEEQRRADVALHVLSVLRARAFTPADQVMVLMMVAGSLIATNTPRQEDRIAAVLFAGRALGSGVSGAAQALDEWMAEIPAEGRA